MTGQEQKDHDGHKPAALPTAAELVQRHGRAVWAVCLATVRHYQDAEDLVQDVMLKAMKKLHHLRQPEQAGPWLLRIARTASLNHLRRRRDSSLREDPPAPAAEDGYEHVHAAIRRLPDPYAEVINLFYLSGCSSAELAQLLGISDALVRQRLVRGRALLHEMLREERP
jgi:RNA polymerase sigma factor (sigma-70 family)